MIIDQFVGQEQIGGLVMSVMETVIDYLVKRGGLLTVEEAVEFLDTHICIYVPARQTYWHRIKKALGWKIEDNHVIILCTKEKA